MPTYLFACKKCESQMSLRRLFEEFDLPAECLMCGQPMQRVFTANANIQVPIAFRQVLSDGSPGGGGLSWSDFHGDVTEKQLAHQPNVIPYNEYMSQNHVREDQRARSSNDERPSGKSAREALDRAAASQGAG